MNTKPRRQPASGAFSLTHTATSNDAYMLTPNVAQHRAIGVAIVTGCTGDIGAAVCRQLADANLTVVGWDLVTPQAALAEFQQLDLTARRARPTNSAASRAVTQWTIAAS